MTEEEINDKIQKMGATKVREEAKRLNVKGKSLSGLRKKVAAALLAEAGDDNAEEPQIKKCIEKFVKCDGEDLTILIAEDDVAGLSDKQVEAFLDLYGAEPGGDARQDLVELLRASVSGSEEAGDLPSSNFVAGDKVLVRNEETDESEEGVIADLSDYDDDDQPADGFVRVEDANEDYEDFRTGQVSLLVADKDGEPVEEAVEDEEPTVCADSAAAGGIEMPTATSTDVAAMSKEDLRAFLTSKDVKFRKNAVEDKLRKLALSTIGAPPAPAPEEAPPAPAPEEAPPAAEKPQEAGTSLQNVSEAIKSFADALCLIANALSK